MDGFLKNFILPYSCETASSVMLPPPSSMIISPESTEDEVEVLVWLDLHDFKLSRKDFQISLWLLMALSLACLRASLNVFTQASRFDF